MESAHTLCKGDFCVFFRGTVRRRSLTDARAVPVGQEVLGELALGGADEFDLDLVGRRGCGRGRGSGDHGGQKGKSHGDGDGLHVAGFWWIRRALNFESGLMGFGN